MYTPKRSTAHSESAYAKACKVMPGGVSSPVRAFKAVGGVPRFIKEAQGCRITDIDGNEYIDYVGSYGPLIVGHANDLVITAITKALGRGTTFGAPTESETRLAEMILSALPGMEMIRFVNSGTEAAMSALRLARAFTGRDLIVKCIGCYHGHVDALLVEAGSGALTLGTPSSPGVPRSITSATISVHYNSLEEIEAAFRKYPDQIACVAVEPIAGNMGLIPPEPGYLQGLRSLCDQNGALLLFDEVMTGFRVTWGGAQVLYDVKPDLTCLGKIIGGGLPVGAYAGPKKIMQKVSPSGPVYQAGTLSGNPLAMSCGLATLELLREADCYQRLEKISAQLAHGLANAAEKSRVPLTVNRVGSMVCPFFVKEAGKVVRNYSDATACDTEKFARFFHIMLDLGVYLPPSQFETWFVSTAHDEQAIDQTLSAAEQAFSVIAKDE
ncbi:MAG: glutamate-1-semialdehyde 2,1-aminomutase [Phycisphaerae bacterium]|jgi:glutamate-1-semialdehyde 2,1-aminomutase|nr:MAG: glutamate-1-semialdehyde 2,1-aminomutase [Phycisphaerae bacterium]